MLRIIGSFIATLVLSGCTTSPRVSDLKKIESAEATLVIELAQGVSYSERRGIGVLWTLGLTAGRYVPEYEDDDGVFYRGPSKCVTQSAPQVMKYEGGVWLSKSGKPPRLYYYFDYDKEAVGKAGLLVSAIVASGKGKLEYFAPINDPAFISYLSPRAAH